MIFQDMLLVKWLKKRETDTWQDYWTIIQNMTFRQRPTWGKKDFRIKISQRLLEAIICLRQKDGFL